MSVLTTARQRIADIYARHGTLVHRSIVLAEAREGATSDERSEVESYGWDRLFGEVERTRDKRTRLRNGESVSRDGGQLSLSLLSMTVPEARANNERKRRHASGVMYEVEQERLYIEIAEQRMRERGLNPEMTTLVIGEFIDAEEIAELRKRAA